MLDFLLFLREEIVYYFSYPIKLKTQILRANPPLYSSAYIICQGVEVKKLSQSHLVFDQGTSLSDSL